MKIDDILVSRLLIEEYMADFLASLQVDVAIVGAGPAGLTAAYYLAKASIKVVVYERKLAIGGGMWGGGAMFSRIVIQEEAKQILDQFKITTIAKGDGYYVADAIEAITLLAAGAIQAGAKVFNLIHIEDLLLRNDRVEGLVLQWSPVEMGGLHVDPITIGARVVIDATGHDCEVVKKLLHKGGVKIDTATGGMLGERPMWAERGEQMTVQHTQQVYPGLYVAGMAVGAVFGTPRMGPIFGGMLLSGKKAAQIIAQRLS
ncbi:sulfide-dependent adenosine diphosphate thiazole synthase [Candidatus Acetothermia bacterium]|nr:sulfide-dependent adenosine diphosphate thiazole synthase [Candidatus Acetothermia bacterium]